MIRRVWKIFSIIIAIASVGCWRDGVLVVDEPIEVIAGSLSDIVPALMDENDVVGLSVIVIRENKVRISNSFGYAELKSTTKINKHTVYKAASLGKPIFAYIIVDPNHWTAQG